ncbi:response regulator [Salinimonas sp. HHU 13199]|uniref:histidine kinase n=1 Tax=Salinimonas profundi TaxID=2729140 RepID=A0ABR8LL04_9ALTE|nr:PAS domain-containing sensor histidine kinase [Salinimonas profundi]MBD3586253.1 response regulator [Salinimonas profundi]
MRLSLRYLQDKSRWILLIVPAMLIISIATAVIFHIREKEVDYRVSMVYAIEQAESDFTNGLMHFALSGEAESPWQRRVGMALITQALSEYQSIAHRLNNQSSSQDMLKNVKEMSLKLNTLVESGDRVDAEFREEIYQISSQADRIERQLAESLEKRRVQQRHWFMVIIVLSSVLLAFLGLALFRSERYRFALSSSLQLSEQRFLRLLQNTDDVFWLETFDSEKALYVSQAFSKMVGRDAKAVLNQKSAWRKLVHPDDIDAVEKARTEARQSPRDFKCRIVRPDGQTRWIEGRMFPIWKEQHEEPGRKPDFMASISRDVTEKRDIDYRLFQAQKMESLGQLTGGVAHDFNNLLTVILINTRHLIGRLQDAPDLARMMTLIMRAAERGARLNQRLLAFASKQQLQPEVTLVEELIDESVEMLARTLGEKYQLTFQRPDQPLWVRVDPGQLQNALVNLCLNSRDAMPDGGRITIRLEKSGHKKLFGIAGDTVHISVKDDGEGIAQDVLDRVLEPFFTTKTSDKGTGLGLSMVFGFVRQSGGNMHINSMAGRGTTVHMVLPTCASGNKRLPAKPLQPTRGTTILLVEDDELVRESTTSTLQKEGYRVIQAETAEDALKVLDAKADIDLVLTDVVMPGALSGFELAEWVQTTHPALRILVTSGFVGNKRSNSERWFFLQKPFSTQSLLAHVNQALNTADSATNNDM